MCVVRSGIWCPHWHSHLVLALGTGTWLRAGTLFGARAFYQWWGWDRTSPGKWERGMNTARLAVCVLAALGAWSQLDSADARERRRGSSSEARVEQARGILPPGSRTIDAGRKEVLRGTPEGGTGSAAIQTGPTAPVTCNQQNASSPACYSATKQARPPTR
jgi:hypothetical protein